MNESHWPGFLIPLFQEGLWPHQSAWHKKLREWPIHKDRPVNTTCTPTQNLLFPFICMCHTNRCSHHKNQYSESDHSFQTLFLEIRESGRLVIFSSWKKGFVDFMHYMYIPFLCHSSWTWECFLLSDRTHFYQPDQSSAYTDSDLWTGYPRKESAE